MPSRFLVPAAVLFAAVGSMNAQPTQQAAPPAPEWATVDDLLADARNAYNQSKRDILRAAEQIPAEAYSFQPTPEVRTVGQLFAHIADFQFVYCGAAKGEPKSMQIEQRGLAKPELVAMLRAGFLYCDEIYNGINAHGAMMKVPLYGGERARLSVLNTNAAHNLEHYGNLVTYMRVQGMVPPSSQ